ncbi:DNA-binding protein [Clostridium sp. MF28]|uniref:helix-turn-helix domain-containing protein n=1 Tax=Clostridium TaxID=1485 RepID=UPI000CF9789E|nr:MULTISPECIES: XRE family transcriptional regulator [Clostridium]AVK49396.1 DNA-binding protein [Clostridium sp. MF28]PSM57986.1 DNA-binding protein [Clostridium diolis]
MIKNREFNGERLKTARLYRNKTIKELADDTEITKQSISQFENNKSVPSLETLLKIINALNFPREYFYQEDDKSIHNGNMFFRALAATSKKEQLCQVNKTKILSIIYNFIGQYIDFPTINIPDISSCNGDIKLIANEVRSCWDLGNRPINNIINVMEKNGIIISCFKTDEQKIDAFTQINTINGVSYPIVVLGDDKEAAVRRQFSGAHELGHIIMHGEIGDINEMTKEEYKLMENQANEFAAELLLPRETFWDDLIQYPNKLEFYIELKKKWRVSISAMIIRAFRLGAITHNQYQYLMKQLSKKGWRTKEPLDDIIQVAKPTLLRKSIEILIENNVLDENEFIEQLQNYGLAINSQEVENLLGLDKGRLSRRNKESSIVINLKRE